ncbi:MAG TPA: hypothetical protein VGO52_20900 [Hyphomonadaceae bacterium]|jgi:hypothetical protein|nr:hypothetical protein [Hyphomonadaceae bacterium]
MREIAMEALYLPLGLFAVAAVIGVYMASRVFGGNMAPWAAGVIHALLAASGLVLLLLAYLNGGLAQTGLIALVVLVVAALGGFFLGSFHLRKQVAPKPVVVIHALAAVAGFLLLAAATFGLA